MLRTILAVLACLSFLQASMPSCARSPSVLVMIADDMGWGDLRSHGNSNLETPNLDRLAAEGARFERFYVQPVCSPTRAELLTGRYAPRDGVVGVTAGGERLDPTTPTVVDAFADAGYATGAFGKWHNGTQAPHHPLCRGFDTFYGFTSGHWADYYSPMLDHNGTIVTGDGFLADDLTNKAIGFIEDAGDEPFFAWVAFNTPHSPMQVPDRWWERHAKSSVAQRGTSPEREELQHTRAALAMCENLDWNVGRLLDAVDEGGRALDTIVVFMSDNGPNGHRYNDGLRGIKGSTDEGGVRSPLFVRWTGNVAPDTKIGAPAAAIDLAPTLAELAGIELLDGPERDGASVAGLLLQKSPDLPERTLFSHWDGRVAARRGHYLRDDRGRLYDLSQDPGQTQDIASQNPAIAARLRDEVTNWRSEVMPTRVEPPRPFAIGHPSMLSTQLPARDATTRGGVRRSNRYFNCTYFTDWDSPDDAIVWDAEVVETGRFRATLYYTCPEEDIGSTVSLLWKQASRSATVSEAHDPPLTASTRDRVPRKEGDMKRFRPLDLGVLEMEKGSGELTLRADSIPSASVMDIRLLVLTRQP